MTRILSILFLLTLPVMGQVMNVGTLTEGTAPAAGGIDDPTDIAALYVWYKADAGVLNGSDAAASTTEDVKTWQDQSGNTRHLTQTNAYATNQPTYYTGIKNSLAALQFNIASDHLTNDFGATITQPSTWFAVISTTTNTISGSYFFLADGIDATDRQIIGIDNSDSWYYDAGTPTTEAAATPTSATWYIITATFNSDSSTFRTNGVERIAGNPGAQSLSGITVGALYGENLGWGNGGGSAYIGEIGVYNSALTAQNLTDLEAYLNTRWSVY